MTWNYYVWSLQKLQYLILWTYRRWAVITANVWWKGSPQPTSSQEAASQPSSPSCQSRIRQFRWTATAGRRISTPGSRPSASCRHPSWTVSCRRPPSGVLRSLSVPWTSWVRATSAACRWKKATLKPTTCHLNCKHMQDRRKIIILWTISVIAEYLTMEVRGDTAVFAHTTCSHLHRHFRHSAADKC